MKIIADLHIHSKYSRACSIDLSFEKLEKYARIKGLNMLGTGDFTHPKWMTEIKQLKEDDSGILKSDSGFMFILQTEIANIFHQDGKLRKVHNIILAKDIPTAEQINEKLAKRGNLSADGRPIFGNFSCTELVEEMKEIDKSIEIIPAHAWTPWFSVFGSMSGFDSLQDCFKEKTKYIYAIETGMSSDPAMNWRLSFLDGISLVSNSDSHSYWPWRIGRECNIFDIKPSYESLINAIRTRKGFLETIEVDPNYGKYHYDGHRNCNISLTPKEAIRYNNICPVCKKPLTLGVLHRVEELADRPEGYTPKDAVPFRKMIPLSEIIAHVKGVGIATKVVWDIYNKLIGIFGSEFNVLMDAEYSKLKIIDEKLADFIILNRNGKLNVKAGYDGVYGKIIDSKLSPFQKNISEF